MLYSSFLCLMAGLSTGLGGIIVVISKKITDRTMSISQGFAAGVMVTVSLIDMLPHTFNNYIKIFPRTTAVCNILTLFFIGWVIGVLMANIVVPQRKEKTNDSVFTAKRLAAITTAVIVLHNLPEGILTMFSSMENKEFGLTMALAIAMHNLPEGIAVAAPVYYVTNSKKTAVWQSVLAGLAEPLGAFIAYFLLRGFINETFLNGLMPIIAGIMCQTAVTELIPSAIKISNIKHTIYGIIIGIIIMSIGIFLI